MCAMEARDAALAKHLANITDPQLYFIAKEIILCEFWTGMTTSTILSNPVHHFARGCHTLRFYKEEWVTKRSISRAYHSYSEWQRTWLLPKLPESLHQIVLENALILQYDLGNMGYLLEVSRGQIQGGLGITSMTLSFGRSS